MREATERLHWLSTDKEGIGLYVLDLEKFTIEPNDEILPIVTDYLNHVQMRYAEFGDDLLRHFVVHAVDVPQIVNVSAPTPKAGAQETSTPLPA